MKISIYTSLFNIPKYFPKFRENFTNYLLLADELVIATIKDNPEDYALLIEESKKDSRIKVILTDLVKFHPDFDGALKNAALQECSGDILIQLDGDEKISDYNVEEWRKYCEQLLKNPYFQAYYVPSINLHKDVTQFSSIGQKWYVHKRGLFRGVVKFARRADGTHDTSASDSCELIDKQGNLVLTGEIAPRNRFSLEEYAEWLKSNNLPVIFHYGYSDLDRRIEINRDFWQKMWSAEEGKKVEIPLDLNGLNKIIYKHNFNLPK